MIGKSAREAGTDRAQWSGSEAISPSLDRMKVASCRALRRKYSEFSEGLLAMSNAELIKASGRTVAFVADGTEIEVNRLVDDELLPERFYWKTADRREFDLLGAAAALRLNRKFKDLLTRQARKDLLEQLDTDYLARLRTTLAPEPAHDLTVREDISGAMFIIEFKDLSLNVTRELNEVGERFQMIASVEEGIVVNPEIMGGTPVFSGSRLPIETALASIDDGVTLAEMIEDYPFLDATKVEQARLYVRLHPRSGRPRKTVGQGRYRTIRTVRISRVEP